MSTRTVSRIAPGIAVEVEEKRELDRRRAARSPAMPRAVTRMSALHVHVNRIVTVRNRRGNRLAYLRKNRRGGGRFRWPCAGIQHMTAVGDAAAHELRTPAAGILTVGLRVIGTLDAAVPGIQAGNLIAN